MQETNLYTVTVPPMVKALNALSAILDKAAAHADSKKTDWAQFEQALLSSSLIFNQFDFKRQVQVACDNAKNGAARLAGVEAPKFEDAETTIEELKARIAKTIEFIESSIKPEDIIGKEGAQIALPFMKDKHLTGFEYATEYLIPNFYFHVTTAYSILRKNGVALGKPDFMGSLPLKDNA